MVLNSIEKRVVKVIRQNVVAVEQQVNHLLISDVDVEEIVFVNDGVQVNDLAVVSDHKISVD